MNWADSTTPFKIVTVGLHLIDTNLVLHFVEGAAALSFLAEAALLSAAETYSRSLIGKMSLPPRRALTGFVRKNSESVRLLVRCRADDCYYEDQRTSIEMRRSFAESSAEILGQSAEGTKRSAEGLSSRSDPSLA